MFIDAENESLESSGDAVPPAESARPNEWLDAGLARYMLPLPHIFWWRRWSCSALTSLIWLLREIDLAVRQVSEEVGGVKVSNAIGKLRTLKETTATHRWCIERTRKGDEGARTRPNRRRNLKTMKRFEAIAPFNASIRATSFESCASNLAFQIDFRPAHSKFFANLLGKIDCSKQKKDK